MRAPADVVLSVNAAAAAVDAARSVAGALPRNCVYADLNTTAPSLKRELAEVVQVAFADVALVGIVPATGLRTPALASGDGAERFAELLRPLGMPVDVVGAGPGDAAGLKLVRSVLDRLLTGSRRHALRRGEEMRAAAEYLDALGVPPHVARAASAWFHDLLDSA